MNDGGDIQRIRQLEGRLRELYEARGEEMIGAAKLESHIKWLWGLLKVTEERFGKVAAALEESSQKIEEILKMLEGLTDELYRSIGDNGGNKEKGRGD